MQVENVPAGALITVAVQIKHNNSGICAHNLTGGDREPVVPEGNVHWLERCDSGWRPADPDDALALELWEGTN